MKDRTTTERMRICIVNEFFYPDDTGGTGTVLSDLARTLRQNYGDVEIDVVTSDKLYRQWDARLSEFTEWNGIRIFRLNTPHPGGRSAIPRLAVNTLFGLRALGKLRRLGRYDMLLVGTAPPTVAMAASFYKRLTGTPFLYVVYDLDPDRAVNMQVMSPRNPLVTVLRRLQRGWLHTAERVIVLGRCMQEYVGKAYSLPASKIEVIPIGADDELVRPRSKQTRFRTEHGLEGFILCYTGNFGRYHDFDTILDAARELRDRRAGVTVVLVGGGAQKEHIAQRIADESLDNVRLFPFVAKEDYPDLLASADASFVTLEPGMEGLCVPSKFYSILASGRPAIATLSSVSEVARVIAEAKCGIRVDPGDTRGLVEALLHLSGNPETAEAMGERARAVLEQRYSNRRVAEQYYRVMRSVVRQGAQFVLREAPAAREVPQPVLLTGEHDRRSEREHIAAWAARRPAGADERFNSFPSDPEGRPGL